MSAVTTTGPINARDAVGRRLATVRPGATIAGALARKDRTPPPPRKVQAPRVRHTPREKPDRRRLLLLGGVAGGALIAVVVAVAAVALAGGGSASAQSVLTDAGCTVRSFPAQEGQHVETLPKGFEYNSSPPTSGPHNALPATFDVYDEPVSGIHVIHNLEHGGVLVQYGDDVPDAQVGAIVDWYRDDPEGLIVAPRPANGSKITLATWMAPGAAPDGFKSNAEGSGVLATCPSFDESAFEAFKDDYGFHGPEGFPRDLLRPGTPGMSS
jgi:hypothetical protein